jgi:hypothetical protein
MKFRLPLIITSRTSSITNSFVQAIIPFVEPTRDQVDEALRVLGMTYEMRACVYCGTPATDWDHLRPLVKKKRPTGYITEIRNLVPACGPCNQSKGGSEWRKWMEGSAPGSPRTKGVSDLSARIERLDQFEKWGNVRPLRFEDLAGEHWNAHWANLQLIEQKLKEAQQHAAIVRAFIASAHKS